MKTLEKGQEKIEKICEVLRRETLEPAEKKAAEIIEAANQKAKEIVLEAEKNAAEIIKKAQVQVEQERKVFQSSLTQAGRQGLEMLRQEIEHKLFNPELQTLIVGSTTEPNAVAKIIDALIKAIEKQGIASELIAYIPKSVSPQAVNALLLENVAKKLKNGTVEVGDFEGGAKVKLVNKRMTIDMSDDALRELLSAYVRKDFRKFIFTN